MKKIITILGFFLCIIVLAGGFFLYKHFTSATHVHYHAGFHVYVDGKTQDYSDWKYMHQAPCSLSGKQIDTGDEQIEKAHLHERIGDVVHVHRDNATWQDLFTNIKVKIPNDAIGYLNGKNVPNFLTMTIHPYDSLVILIGKNNDVKKALTDAVTKKQIQKIENTSEQCGS